MRAVVVGSEHFIRFWELLGFEGIVAETESELLRTLRSLIDQENVGLILLPERYAPKTIELRERLSREGRIIPVIAFAPESPKAGNIRIDELKRMISLAIGVELRL